MMFFYNYQTFLHKTEQLTDHTCPKCKNRGTMKMIYNQYFTKSIFISTFPFQKFAVLYCDNCEYEIPYKRWDDDLKKLSKKELKKLKTPKELKKGFSRLTFLFFAPIIFFALFLFYQVKFNGAVNSNNDSKKSYEARVAKLHEIRVNDIYFISFVHNQDLGSYGLIKIIATSEESTIIKEYAKRFDEVLMPNEIELADIDQSLFNSPEIMIYTDNFLKQQLLYEQNNPAKEIIFGKAYFKIEK